MKNLKSRLRAFARTRAKKIDLGITIFRPHITVQYRPSEKKTVFGLKEPSGDGLGFIL